MLPHHGLLHGNAQAKRACLLPLFCTERRATLYASSSLEFRSCKPRSQPRTDLAAHANGVASADRNRSSQPSKQRGNNGSVTRSQSQDTQERREITAREAAVRQVAAISCKSVKTLTCA
eukprot:1158878-Pelagomonas_calceolata.AAC.4